MTTAHRPTWAPAKGGEEQGGNRLFVGSRALSAKDQPGHTKLKFRHEGQAAPEDLRKRDLQDELEAKEKQHFLKKKRIDFEEERQKDLLLLESGAANAGGKPAKQLVPKQLDADESDAGDSDDDDSEEDEEDDEAELLRELERIKKERAEEQAKKEAADRSEREKQQQEELIRGNPLLNQGIDADFTIKRRWDEDVVFKNQSRGEPRTQKRFINDTIRSDFHKRFLQRYIR